MPDLYSGGDGECGWAIITDDGRKPRFNTWRTKITSRNSSLPLSCEEKLEPPEKLTPLEAEIILKYGFARDQRRRKK